MHLNYLTTFDTHNLKHSDHILEDMLVRANCDSIRHLIMQRNHKNHIGSPCKSVFDFLSAMKKTRQMQAHILFLTRIEIPALVDNFELKTLSRGGELRIEILSQGLGRL